MLPRFLSLVAISGALVNAKTRTFTGSSTAEVCSTEFGSSSGSVAPTPIPSITTATSVASTTSTFPTETDEQVLTITVATKTLTRLTATSTIDVVKTAYKVDTSLHFVQTTIATATIPVTDCTNGIVPKTVTKYVGTYKPVSGQATTLPKTYPTQVVCQEYVTTFVNLHPVVTTTRTTSVTHTSYVYSPTTTKTTTHALYTTNVYTRTVTTSYTSYGVADYETTIQKACHSTVTTTYAAKCAPTNLIGAINNTAIQPASSYPEDGKPVAASYGAFDITPYGHDFSACCQLCHENEGCAAVRSNVQNGCILLYLGGPSGAVCKKHVFTYATDDDFYPGQGIVVQSGCGKLALGTFPSVPE